VGTRVEGPCAGGDEDSKSVKHEGHKGEKKALIYAQLLMKPSPTDVKPSGYFYEAAFGGLSPAYGWTSQG